MYNEKNNKIIEFNLMKAIAVVLVTIGHAAYYTITTKYGGINYSLDTTSINMISQITLRIIKIIIVSFDIFVMPLYFIVSGALFKNSLNYNQYKNVKDVITKKSKRLLIPFLIVTLLYSVPIKYISGYYSQSQNILKDILIGQIAIQGNTHLWFLPTLFCIFIIVYILKQKIHDKISTKVIFMFLIVINIISSFVDIIIIKMIFYYLLYFSLGFYLADRRLKINNQIDTNKKIKWYLIFGIALRIIISFIDFSGNIYYQIIEKILNIAFALLGTYIIYYIVHKLSKKEAIIQNSLIQKVCECSFGIYLYSDPLNYIILFLANSIFQTYMTTTLGIIILFIFRIIVTFLIAMGITVFFKKRKVKYVC